MSNTTIHEVARLAGVSSATVSRVLNQSDKVTTDTRRRVLDAVSQLKYAPNASSRNLRTKESHMLLVILPTLSNPFYSDILAGMDACTYENGYNMLVTVNRSSVTRERELLRLMHQRQADGVVLMTPTLPPEEMAALNAQFPVIQCCEYYEDIGVPYVSVDNYGASYEATMYLIRSGHHVIAMSSSANNYPSTRLREKGFRQAHIDAGLPLDERLIRRGGYTFDSGFENAQVFLRMKDRPTAIMGISDVVAAGAISAVIKAGLRVPDDVSIMGFDNLDMAKMIQPTLSTVMQPRRRMGRTAVELLLERLRGGEVAHELLLPYELIIRHTTR
ncbi:LacI family DNA-binding transcriptional regulator [Eubacteriales bacterium OttesenSCG-928-N13]|nr:LacI family DNA-binding transcriptional regulator [Eubacteriales bacterium OttesenSCG-928-N13]